jgi:hypothetical protein
MLVFYFGILILLFLRKEEEIYFVCFVKIARFVEKNLQIFLRVFNFKCIKDWHYILSAMGVTK